MEVPPLPESNTIHISSYQNMTDNRSNNNNNAYDDEDIVNNGSDNDSSSHASVEDIQDVLNAIRRQRLEDSRSSKKKYNWRTYSPNDTSCWHFFRWLMVGGSAFATQSDKDIYRNLTGLARCLSLLREYMNRFGMPDKTKGGGPVQQEMLLREILRDLYAGGTPLWALDSTMQKVAEGLTGDNKVNWLILPRKAFLFAPASLSTFMFKIERGFFIRKMEAMEPVAVRLASFASNTNGTGDVPTRFPNPAEFRRAFRNESARNLLYPEQQQQEEEEAMSQDELAKTILDLASESQGIFFYVNSRGYLNKIQQKPQEGEGEQGTATQVDAFWEVTDQERELFTRLAAMEAIAAIEEIDRTEGAKVLYPPAVIIIFRVLASAGAAGFWFGGSWVDMLIAGILAVVVAFIGNSKVLSKQEKIVFETVASFVVGLASGMIALKWPVDTCYQAMAIAGVLDILQGFRVVYAIIETMSKHTVAGAADLFEGVLFSGLIVSFLRIGQYCAAYILENDAEAAEFSDCTNGISHYWYILFVPLAALSWSGLFNPNYSGLIPMTFHGCLAFGVNYSLSEAQVNNNLNNFVSAMVVTLSAGIFSRFTGRQAVGNTAAGLYVVLPGAYLVSSLYKSEIDNSFFTDITVRSVVIGIGAWTGTILCSPTLLGSTRGLANQMNSMRQGSWHGQDGRSERAAMNAAQPATMLFF